MDVDSTVNAIKSMEIRGAGRIARAGASALADFAGSYEGDDSKGFMIDLMAAKAKILDSRPTAVSLWNGVHATLKGVEGCGSVEDAKRLIIANAERFNEGSVNAV